MLEFQLSFHKCKIDVSEMTLLGHLIKDNQIFPTPERIKQIKDVPRPVLGEQLATFLGLVVYMAQQIPHIATIAAPL